MKRYILVLAMITVYAVGMQHEGELRDALLQEATDKVWDVVNEQFTNGFARIIGANYEELIAGQEVDDETYEQRLTSAWQNGIPTVLELLKDNVLDTIDPFEVMPGARSFKTKEQMQQLLIQAAVDRIHHPEIKELFDAHVAFCRLVHDYKEHQL